jgi:hypothetical protein
MGRDNVGEGEDVREDKKKKTRRVDQDDEEGDKDD